MKLIQNNYNFLPSADNCCNWSRATNMSVPPKL